MSNYEQQSETRFLPAVNQMNRLTKLALSQFTTNNLHCHFLSTPVRSQQVEVCKKVKSPQEVTIPVPWGHISGKWWGSQNVTPLIGLHGHEDNAGTFDRIAPLLSVPAFLAWDAPGHGKSSKYPKGVTYNFLDFVLCFRFVVLHFGWKKVSILGHSYGSALGLVYAALYPKEVHCLMRIECTGIAIFLECKTLSHHKKVFENTIKSDSLENPPVYTWEELVTAYCKGTKNSVSRDHAQHILIRGATKHPVFEERFFFSRDPKLRFSDFSRPDISLLEECAENVKCHVLTIFGTEGLFNISRLNNKSTEQYRNLFDLYSNQERSFQKYAASYERYDIPGTHHVHLNNPESVAVVVNKFFSHREKSSL